MTINNGGNSNKQQAKKWQPKQKIELQSDNEQKTEKPILDTVNSSAVKEAKERSETSKKDSILFSVPPPPDASAAFSRNTSTTQNFFSPLQNNQLNCEQIKDQIFSLLLSGPSQPCVDGEKTQFGRTIPTFPYPPPFSSPFVVPSPFVSFPGDPHFSNHSVPYSYPFPFHHQGFPINNFPVFNTQHTPFNQQNSSPQPPDTNNNNDNAIKLDSSRDGKQEPERENMQDIEQIPLQSEEMTPENSTPENQSNDKTEDNIIDLNASKPVVPNSPSTNYQPFREIYDEKSKTGPPSDNALNGTFITTHSRKILDKYMLNCERNYAKISRTVDALFEEIRPPKEEMTKRKELLHRIQAIISEQYPDEHAKLHLFGSSANDFCLKDGDIDMCLTIDRTEDQKPELVEQLARILLKNGMEDVTPLSTARVPIVKFKDPKSGFSCDICINNILAVENTKLLSHYAKIDIRLKKLACVVKYWAKRRQINFPYAGTLSSYAYVLLVIHFLQRQNPPILPCLQQDIGNLPKVHIEGYDCTYQTNDLHRYRINSTKNKTSIGKLMVDFYKFYGLEFDYVNCVLSIRTAGYISKEIKDWKRPKHPRESCFLGLEDPFEVTHNLGRGVDKRGIDIIKSEFERAFIILARKGDLRRVSKEYKEDDQDCNWR